jgi:hypothetical protein
MTGTFVLAILFVFRDESSKSYFHGWANFHLHILSTYNKTLYLTMAAAELVCLAIIAVC